MLLIELSSVIKNMNEDNEINNIENLKKIFYCEKKEEQIIDYEKMRHLVENKNWNNLHIGEIDFNILHWLNMEY